jgi:hypothetical protein
MAHNNVVSTMYGKMAASGNEERIWKMVAMKYFTILSGRVKKTQEQTRRVSSLAKTLTVFRLTEGEKHYCHRNGMQT